MGPFELTSDGFEKSIGVSHLAHFELSRLLLPALQMSRPHGPKIAQILNFGSGMHNMADRTRTIDRSSTYGKFSDTLVNSWRSVATPTRPAGGLLPTWALELEAGYADAKFLVGHPGLCEL